VKTVLGWLAAFAVALVALAGLIAFLSSRDQSGVGGRAGVGQGPGERYKGDPVLSPALRDAVRRGNVVVLYRDAKPPEGTLALVPPGGKALEQAGQSVVLDREPTLKTQLVALSATKMLEADRPADLRAFIDYWIGGG
jgi:hypothetical protein